MLREDYLISVKGIQTHYGGKDEMNLQTLGTFRTKGDKQYISYRDYDEDSSVELTLCKDTLTMKKIGDYSSSIMLERDKHHKGIYDTPMGSLKIGVYTYTLDNRLTADGGKLYACYSVDYDAIVASKNEIYIEIEPKNKSKQ